MTIIKNSHDYPRDERIAGMRAVLDFLEANPDFDIPEGVDEFYLRTLPRQNRGGLTTKGEVAAWFLNHVEALQPDRVYSGTDFGAVREFGGGARIVVQVSVSEVCERQTETKVVQRPTVIEESTWQCPETLQEAGFIPDQEKLREDESRFRNFIRNENAA